MTEERSITECIEVIQKVLDDVKWPNSKALVLTSSVEEALEALEMIKNHCNRVDACHYARPPEGAPDWKFLMDYLPYERR